MPRENDPLINNKSVPTTPYLSTTSFPIKRIRSLGKLDVRSPILKNSILNSPDHSIGSIKFFGVNDRFQNFYNDFTTIDWTKAYLESNKFNFDLEHSHLPRKIIRTLEKWVLIVLIGFFFSLIAFCIDKFEILLVGFKYGYCRSNWLASEVTCANKKDWISWSHFFNHPWFDYIIYVFLTVLLALAACLITLTTKITGNLNRVMYTAVGSGVPEVKTILSGFVIRRFLGTYTLITKTAALILAIASGMSLGKEGPYVHLATCCGNVISRFFPYIYNNDLFTKQILSASASAGVALAFGSPLGGVLFILEEINNYLPSHQLFQIFFCAIISTLFLKFLNPYGTGNTVLFELEYTSDWKPFELIFFVVIGIAGGVFGASFVKFTRWWSTKKQISSLMEVFLVSLITGIITFWNPYLKQASAELVLDLATSCSGIDRSLCPVTKDKSIQELKTLSFALIVKIFLTFITFGLKIPCGIYVPSMVVGALFGRIFSMAIVYLANIKLDMGIYSMISAGAFMAGVTHMNITLVTILFELTSSYTYVLPIAISIAVANWSGSLIEKNSLYESLLEMKDFPFMSTETEPIDSKITAGDLVSDVISIDITKSATISFNKLQSKLLQLADRSLIDGCLPVIKNEICVGLIYFLELEVCLDRIKEFMNEYQMSEIYCQLEKQESYFSELTDLTSVIDSKPIFINHDSELSFANLIFDRIGTRVVVLLKNGKFHGVLHKKVLIDYLRS